MYMYKMKSYCLKCKKNSENIDPNVSASSSGRTLILSKCAICGSKKSRFIKLVIRTRLSKVPVLGDILF